jgi:hypothetical protein
VLPASGKASDEKYRNACGKSALDKILPFWISGRNSKLMEMICL